MDSQQSSSSSSNRIQAVENGFNIIRKVQELDGCSTTELVNSMDIPKSTAHIYLKTLEELGYVTKYDNTYHLSIRFLKHGGHARHHLNIYQVARSEIDELSRTISEVATLGCEDDGLRVLLYRTEPQEALSDNAPTGEYTRMHWTALGKALLSQKSDDKVKEIVDQHGLPQATEHTITDLDELLGELESIRSRGYAIENEERIEGIKSVSVPITDSTDLVGNVAISVAGPKQELSTERVEEELSSALQNTANIIELKMDHY